MQLRLNRGAWEARERRKDETARGEADHVADDRGSVAVDVREQVRLHHRAASGAATSQAPARQWIGLDVSTQDGARLGRVVGCFDTGPCAGRLRVHGDAAQFPRRGESGTAVFAIPTRAVAQRDADALLLDTTANAARHRWFMHVIEPASH